MSGFGNSWSVWRYDEPDWDSEYDSTWEDDEDHKLLKQSNPEKTFRQHSRGSRAAQDLQRYRHGYPEPMLNLKFYRNEIPFEPYGVCIDDLLSYWKFDYDELESNHCYIQWLFPLREPGVNRSAIPLTEKEIEKMKKDEDVMKRFLESYKLMLGFYGIELVDFETGEVARADNWSKRFSNLNTNTHNNLRITRILKCLGELGYERYQVPLVKFFLKETLYHGNLKNVKTSALNYFMFTVKNKSERRELVLFAWEHYEPKEEFTWGPMKTLQKLKPPALVKNPDDKSEDLDAECVNISLQNNDRGHISSNHANGKQKKRNRTEKNKSGELLREHAIAGKESTSQGPKKSKVSKESVELSTVSEIRNEKENKELLVEYGQEVSKENEKTLIESESREDSENGGSQVKSVLEDDEEEGGPPMNKFASKEDKKNEEQPIIRSGAAEDKDTKGPSTECEPGDSQEKEREMSTSQDDRENTKPPTYWGSEGFKDNEDQSLQSGAANNKGDTLPSTCESPRGSGLEEEKNGKQPIQSGTADGNDNKNIPIESESGDNMNKGGLLMEFRTEGGKEIRQQPTESGPKEDQENGKQAMQTGSADDKNNRGQATQCESGDKKEKEGPPMESILVEDKGKGEQPMQSWFADGTDNKESPTDCESKNNRGKQESQIQSSSEDSKENGRPMTESGLEDNGNGEQSVQSSAAGDNDNIGSATECESGDNNEKGGSLMKFRSDDKKNGGLLTGSGSKQDKENEEQPLQPGSTDDKDIGVPPKECDSGDNKETVIGVNRVNQGLPKQSVLEENKDNGGKPTERCSEYTKEHGNTLTQSRLGDDRENRESPAESGSGDHL